MSCAEKRNRFQASPLMLLAACLLGACQNTAVLAGESAADTPSPSSATYRRIFVPATQPETWPVGSDRFLPLDSAEFNRLLQQHAAETINSGRMSVSIRNAHYRARWQPDGTLAGTAEWTVELLGDEPRLLPLSPLNLVVESAAWRGSPKQPALFGLWQKQANPGEPQTQKKSALLGVLTGASDTLQCPWRLAPTRADRALAQFDLRLPQVVPQKFDLVLPAQYSAEISQALLLDKQPQLEGEILWSFQLAARERHRLRIRSMGLSPPRQTQPLASQTTAYQISPTGLSIHTQIRLDARESNMTELGAELPSEMEVVKVVVDQKPVAWQVRTESGTNLLSFTKPESLQPQSIEIIAMAKLRADTRWPLPKLRLKGVSWTEGSSSLLVSPELELRALTPHQASLQHIVGINNTTDEGEAFRLREWSEQAELEILVSRPTPRVSARLMTTIALGEEGSNAILLAKFTNAGADAYQLQATVAPGWSIDSVSTSPVSWLNEWHVEHGNHDAKLHLQLNQPLSAEGPLEVRLQARETSAESQLPTRVLPASVGQLRLLRFLDTDLERELLRVLPPRNHQVTLSSRPGGSRALLEEVPPEFENLASEPKAGTLLDVLAVHDEDILELRQQTSEYDANVKMTVEMLSDAFRQQYQIDCQLHTESVAEIVLQFDEPLPESAQWEIVGPNGRLPIEPIDTELDAQPRARKASYLLRIPRGVGKSFHLETSYVQPARPEQRANLVRPPHAVQWNGRLVVRGPLDRVEVIDSGWTPTAIPLRPSGASLPPVLGVYRLGPEEYRRGELVGGLRLRLRESWRDVNQERSPRLVAWLAEYQTLQAVNGDAIQTASFFLENLGTNQAIVTLPEGAELQEAWVNDQLVSLSQIASANGGYVFPLPPEQPWPQLALKFRTHAPDLSGTATISPAMPTCSFPIFRSRWTLWAPEQFEIENSLLRETSIWEETCGRLFGPLARPRSDTVFAPLRASQWAELWAAPLESQLTKQAAERLAKQLARKLQTSLDASLATALAESLEQTPTGARVLVDRTALLARGIEPETPRGEWLGSRGPMRHQGASPPPLSGYHLALLVEPGTLVLTTAERVALWHDDLRPTETVGVYVVDFDARNEQIEAAHGPFTREFIDFADWVRSTMKMHSPWIGSIKTKMVDVGRRARTVEFIAEVPQMVVRRAFAQRALWHSVLLLTLVIGVYQLARFPSVMLLVAILAAALCLVSSPRWLTVPQAIFLGMFAAAIIRLAIKPSSDSTGASFLSVRGVPVSAWLGVAIAFAWLATPTQAQHFSANSSEQSLPRVLVPVDAQGNPQGDEVFLPTKFLEKLQLQSVPSSHDGAAYVVLAANYEGGLTVDSAKEAVAGATSNASTEARLAEPWKLSWQIESFEPDCLVSLPLHYADARWLAKQHRLDGLPVVVDWQPQGEGCTVRLPRAGVHRLELLGHPFLTIQERQVNMRLRVPPLSGATVEVALPPRTGELRIHQAVQDTRASSSSQWRGLLDMTTAIDMSWSLQTPLEEATTWQRLEQRGWLQVEPASAWFDVQLALTAFRSSTRIIELDISPQLQLQPVGAESLVEEVLEPLPNKPTLLRLRLRSGLPEIVVIPLRFEFQREISVGRLPFPSVRVLGSAPAQNLFAISVAAGFSYDEQTTKLMQAIQPGEFTSAWGANERQPLFAYALGKDQPDWSLRVWPDPTTFRADQRMQVKFFPRETRVTFDATLSEVTGGWHMHQLIVPESLRIDDISVLEQPHASPVPLRWSRASATEVVVFLERPLQGAHTLKLRGHRDVAAESVVELPLVRLLPSERSDFHLDLYRSEEVQLHWLVPQLTPKEVLGQNSSNHSDEILVGHYTWRDSLVRPLSKLRLERNLQTFEATSVTTVELGLADWTARCESQISVRRGIVSRLRLAAPESFRPPYSLEPAQVGTIDEVRDTSTGREIIVLLNKPVSRDETLKLSLSGSMSLPADQRLIVPSLRWADASRQERYVVLPTRIHQQPLQWQTKGLRRHPLPAFLEVEAASASDLLPFRVEQEEFQAAERIYRGTLRDARVRSTQITGIVDSEGQLSATAELIFQPGRASSCAVRLPPNSQMLQLTVDDHVARRETSEAGNWKIPTGPPFMPIRIVVNYLTHLPRAGSHLTLDVPRIVLGDQTLPRSETWWYIKTTEGLQPGDPVVGTRTDRLHFVKNQYRQTLLVLEDSLSQALELPHEEAQAWASTWLAACDMTESTWQDVAGDAHNEQDLPTADLAREALTKLHPTEPANADMQQPVLLYPPPLPINVDQGSPARDHFFVTKPSDSLVVALSTGSLYDLWRPFAALALVSAAGALIAKRRHLPAWHQRLRQWPHCVALVGGLLWWLLLRPSGLGLLVMVLALVSLAMEQWREHRYRGQEVDSVSFETP